MKVIVRPRQMGKTTELIKYAAEYGYVIVVHRHDMIRHYENLAAKMGLKIEKPICWGVMSSSMENKSCNGFVIDNLDIILNTIFYDLRANVNHGSPVKGFTVSGINEYNYDEQRDVMQYEEFKKYRPNLTFQEFNVLKYNLK